MQSPFGRVIRIFLYVLAITGLSYAVFQQYLISEAFKKESIKTKGVIKELVRVHSTDQESAAVYYYPIIEYQDEQGKTYSFKSEIDNELDLPGDFLAIVYLKTNHADAREDSFIAVYKLVILYSILLVVLLIFFVIDLYLINLHRNDAKIRERGRVLKMKRKGVTKI